MQLLGLEAPDGRAPLAAHPLRGMGSHAGMLEEPLNQLLRAIDELRSTVESLENQLADGIELREKQHSEILQLQESSRTLSALNTEQGQTIVNLHLRLRELQDESHKLMDQQNLQRSQPARRTAVTLHHSQRLRLRRLNREQQSILVRPLRHRTTGTSSTGGMSLPAT